MCVVRVVSRRKIKNEAGDKSDGEKNRQKTIYTEYVILRAFSYLLFQASVFFVVGFLYSSVN